ncbi:MAG: hypothetical protein ACP5G6_03595 [Conexivisphaera sp.]
MIFSPMDLEEMIIMHLERYGPDCRWMLARRLLGASGYRPSFDESEVAEACENLVRKGLVEVRSIALKRGPTSSVKPWLKNRAREGHLRRPRCFLTEEGRRVAAQLRHEAHP